MAVFRVEKNSGYTVMSNHHLRNQELSLKAKGLLSQMLSLPDNWDYTLKGLSLINREKIDAIREAIRELERAGYIVRSRERDEKGRLRGADYIIYELPQKPVSDLPTLENPTLDNPTQENPTLENPTLENPTQLNKDILRTDLSKKEKSITDLSSTDSIPILSPYPFPLSVDGKQAAAPPERKRKETAESENEAYRIYREIICDNIEFLVSGTDWCSNASNKSWNPSVRQSSATTAMGSARIGQWNTQFPVLTPCCNGRICTMFWSLTSKDTGQRAAGVLVHWTSGEYGRRRQL